MLDAVIIEPVLEKRANLREIARDFCRSVVASSTLQDGLERVKNGKNCDVIYVSSKFDFEAATQFLVSTRQTETGRDSANLLISSSENLNERFLAKLMLKGFDGMLLEPASVDTFKISAELALKARNAKLIERQERSIDVMVKALADQLDELTVKKRLKQGTILAQDRFTTLSKEVSMLNMDGMEAYLKSLVEVFCVRNPPLVDINSVPHSASSRVIRKHLSK